MQCFVSGRVQGVFYRASARHEADRLGVTGFARNLPDGRVEVMACGPKAQVDELCAWLSRGPQNAEVSNISCQTVDAIIPANFTIG
ncbi:MAG: acylphosphatase [Gammaproteobacteria bacterium]|nr:acylphosphatase [Gammaproteobacteria bacterium]